MLDHRFPIMKKALAFTYTLAMIWSIIKIVFYLRDDAEMGFNVGVMANILFVLLVIVITLWFKYKEVKLIDSSLISDIKDGLRKAMVYLILVSGMMVLYYGVLDKDFLQGRANARIEMERENAMTNEAFEEWKKSDDTLEDISLEQYMSNFEDGIRENYRIKTIVPGALLLMLILSIVYSLLVSLLFRKVLLK